VVLNDCGSCALHLSSVGAGARLWSSRTPRILARNRLSRMACACTTTIDEEAPNLKAGPPSPQGKDSQCHGPDKLPKATLWFLAKVRTRTLW